MQKGWNAKGCLTPLYKKHGGVAELAERTGIVRQTLGGYNTGRLPLGIENAQRIADAADVTLEDLGYPSDLNEASRAIRTLVREELIDVLRKEQFPRLESLASSVEDHFVATGVRLDALEVQLRSLRRRRGGEGEG